MSASRGEFTSRLGFIMAAAGSAVGLGNIWGFPTQTATNGGAAFVLVYLILAFCLAYPAFMAEIFSSTVKFHIQQVNNKYFKCLVYVYYTHDG